MTYIRSPFTIAVLLAAVFPALGGISWAQFTQVGPFAGSHQEGFETQDTSSNPFPTCVEDRAFNGDADLCSSTAGAHITSGWQFGCGIQEHGGARLFGTTGGAAVFTFDSSAMSFGGYFGTNNPTVGDGAISFYDEAGTLLHSDLITAPNDCTWTWNGWDFGGVLVKSIWIQSNYSSGGYMMLDDLEADLVPGEVGTVICSCDGSQSSAPCGNFGSAGHGCGNSFSASGARLHGSGFASMSASSLKLHGVDLVPGWEGVFFQGDLALNNGSGYVLGDGLRCAGVNVRRLEVVMTSLAGTVETSVDLTAVHGNPIAPGDTKCYQLWYRDGAPGPCSSGFNLTNAIEVTWLP
jgi:hypothetical protein